MWSSVLLQIAKVCKNFPFYPFFKTQFCDIIFKHPQWSSGITLEVRSFCQMECGFESHQSLRIFFAFEPFKNHNFTKKWHCNCSLKVLKPNRFSEPVMWILTIVQWSKNQKVFQRGECPNFHKFLLETYVLMSKYLKLAKSVGGNEEF